MNVWTTSWHACNLENWFRGRHAFLVLSGPSLNDVDLSALSRRGIVSMGVNNSWLVHRPNLWLCVDTPNRFADVGWKDAGIVKFVPAEHARSPLRVSLGGGKFRTSQFRVDEMPSTFAYRRVDYFDHRSFLDQPGVPWGCPSSVADSLGMKGKRSCMQAAIAMLAYLGASTIYLVGADFKMTSDRRYAFDEGRTASAVRHNNVLFDSLNKRFHALRPHFAERGVRILNTTADSGLDAFDHMPFDEAVDRASNEASKPVESAGWYEPVRKR